MKICDIKKAMRYMSDMQLTAESKEDYKLLEAAYQALNEKLEQNNNEPLTLDELISMNRNVGYVWIVDSDTNMPFEGWAVCDGTRIYYYYFNKYCAVGTATKDLDDNYYAKNYGKTWFAYRRPPKGENNGKTD